MLDLHHGEPNAAWFPCNSWFTIWRSIIRNWSFFVPLKQLVLHLEIYDTKMKYKILFTEFMDLQIGERKAAWSKIIKWNIRYPVLDLHHGEPNTAWFPCISWFSIWRSMIRNWSFLVPLKQLDLQSGEPKVAWFTWTWNSWFSIWRSMILTWNKIFHS